MFRFLILKFSTIKNKIYSENFNRLKNKFIKKLTDLKNNLICARAREGTMVFKPGNV
jgi:hypothetical protein